MTPQLSQDVEKLVSSDPTGAVRVQGSTGGVFWVLTEEAMQVRQLVQEGIAEAERGDCSAWNGDEIKRDGRERLAKLKHDRRSS